jgi:hypothetical protein
MNHRGVKSKFRAACAVALCSCRSASPAPEAARPVVVASAATAVASAEPPPVPDAAAPPAEPASFDVELVREIEAPSAALALDVPPHAAALSQSAAWIHDARGWRSEALPASVVREPAPKLAIFYGRDHRVRVVGTHLEAGVLGSVYLRSKPNGLIDGGGEIGRFADNKGGLVAVLGDKDPEIVCRLGDACVVKRRSGWTFIPIVEGLERVVLGDDVGWALGGHTLHRLDGTFHAVGAPGSWQHADDLFALRDRAFVVETEAGLVHAFDGTAWQAMPSPIPHPRAMWGASAKGLWLVGDGIALHDGTSWRVAKGVSGPFVAVLGRGEGDVWIAGPSGVFRVRVP